MENNYTDSKLIILEHKLRMQSLAYTRETERLKHEWGKERLRINAAETRKNIERQHSREGIKF